MGSDIRDSIVVSISACHAEDPGSIPGRGVYSPRPLSALADSTRFGLRPNLCRHRKLAIRVKSQSFEALRWEVSVGPWRHFLLTLLPQSKTTQALGKKQPSDKRHKRQDLGTAQTIPPPGLEPGSLG